MFCLIVQATLIRNYPHYFYNYNLKWPTVVLSVKIYCGFFWSAYLHENSRQGIITIQLLMLTKVNTIKLMCATLNFMIRQNNVDTHLFKLGPYYSNEGKGD